MSNELINLISKKEVFEEIITLKTKKEVIDFLNKKGYKVKDENEIESLKEYLSNIYKEIIQTISEQDLENISGGKRTHTETGASVGMVAGSAIGATVSSATLIATNALLKKKGKKSISDLGESIQFIISIGSLVAGGIIGGTIGTIAGGAGGYLLDKK